MQDILDAIFAPGGYVPVQEPRLHGTYAIVNQSTGAIVESNLSHAVAVKRRDFLKLVIGGTYDIIENDSWANGEPVFVGNPSRFSHIPSHASHDGPMYDVQIDGTIVAHDLTIEQAETFVSESVNMLDVFSAIAEFLVSPTFSSFEDSLEVLSKLTLPKIAGATFIMIPSAENDAPIAQPPIHDWKSALAHTKALKRFVQKVHITETRIEGYISDPKILAAKGYAVIDVRDMSDVFHGLKTDCKSYLSQRIAERGNHIYDYRIVRYSDFAEYIADLSENGFVMYYLGKAICIGTRGDIRQYVHNRKDLNLSNVKIERLEK